MAFANNDDLLKSHVLNYVKTMMDVGNFNELFNTDDWFDFAVENRLLAKQIMSAVSTAIFNSNQ